MSEQKTAVSRTKLQTITIRIHGTDSLKKITPPYGVIILRRCYELFAQHTSNTIGRAESTEPIVRVANVP